MNEIIRDIWELYGVHSNPFSTAPILVKGGIIPLDCFIGRQEQTKQLGKILGSKGGSRSLVFGDIGVGKTSFVNVVRAYAVVKGYFTPFKEIALQSDWTPDDFILNTFAGIFATLQLMKIKPVSDETYSKLESLIAVGFSDKSFNLEILGVGGGYAKDRKPSSSITSFALTNYFEQICQEISEKTGHDIIIHYNNTELLSEKSIKKLFENLRDFFQTEGVHFVFVGNLTVKGYFLSIPRFSSIMTDTPISIEPFTLEEVDKIIKKRFESMQIEGLDYVVPFTKDCLKMLYDLWGGNIRHILNSLSTAVQELTVEKPVTIDENILARTLNSVLEKRYYSRITPPRALDVLKEIVKREEITNKSLSDLLDLPRSNISGYLRDLEAAGCVYLRRKTGKDKFWSADPTMKWMLLRESKVVQKSLQTF
ncbi:MAG: winged helix-turn-helix transcriptional regulator [Candidatus Methanoperedens sp.]|nr:winged helix-turn-helix transcriptional regulator [Candidatus Methanoperedens sp.]